MHNARIRLTLPPDQDGAKGLRAEYGERLVCVRYRYDTHQQKRYQTVELVVAEEQWTPPLLPPGPEQIVTIRVSAPETTVRQQVKNAGGQWDPQRGVWTLRYDRVVALGLSKRIVNVTSC
jgi:hypothetical protein